MAWLKLWASASPRPVILNQASLLLLDFLDLGRLDLQNTGVEAVLEYLTDGLVTLGYFDGEDRPALHEGVSGEVLQEVGDILFERGDDALDRRRWLVDAYHR